MSLSLGYALKSFQGFLEGTGKASHTISSYALDLQTFISFLKETSPRKLVRLDLLNQNDFQNYFDFLKKEGFKTNSRRRKILTLKRFFRYLKKRKKLSVDPSIHLPAPYKVEKVPHYVDGLKLISAIRSLPTHELLDRRNRLILWVLAETACNVSELAGLRLDSVSETSITFFGRPSVGISRELGKELIAWTHDLSQEMRLDEKVLFPGFNRFGPFSGGITSRGCELLVKAYSSKLGFQSKQESLTPRKIRHSVVIQWLKSGMTREAVKERLGLKSDYAFRVYRPFIVVTSKSKTKTTSNA